MKRCKFGILTIIMISLFLANETTAEVMGNQSDKNRHSPGHNSYRVGKVGPYGGKVVIVDASGRHGVEAKTEDEANSVTWDAAVIDVQKYGPGWRLPTISELRMMYEQRELIGGFAEEDYWSSTEQDVNSAWIQGFRLGDQDRYNKQSKLKVRAVRSF